MKFYTCRITWGFEVAKKTDAFICFSEIHTPRETSTTTDDTTCDTTKEDYVELKDETGTSMLICCGTQCHKKTFKIVKQNIDKTYYVVLNVQGRDKYPGFGSTTFPVVGTLPKYDSDLNKDIVRFYVSAQPRVG